MIDDRHHHCEPCMERPIHLHVSGLGGDGNSSYTLLTNKPKINGHELVGNKTSKDLGIPVKTSDLEDDGTYIKEQVQSDWNEDDPTNPAYIKNRPFYTGLIPGDAVFNETVLIKDYTTYGYGYKKEPSNFLYEEGKKYIISWDGTEYTFTAETKDGHVTIGDISVEPYIRSYTYTDINTGNSVLIIDHPSDVDAEHAIKITPMTGGIVPIPTTYMPETVMNAVNKIPETPATDGTYTLKAKVENGVASYYWE